MPINLTTYDVGSIQQYSKKWHKLPRSEFIRTKTELFQFAGSKQKQQRLLNRMGEAFKVAAQHPRHSKARKIPNSWPSSLGMIRVLWMVVSFSFDFYFLPRITSNLKNYTSPPLQLPWTQFPVLPYYTLGNYSPKLTYWTTTFDMDGLHHLITWKAMELDISHELFTCTLLVGRSVVADEKWEFRSKNVRIACTILEEKN